MPHIRQKTAIGVIAAAVSLLLTACITANAPRDYTLAGSKEGLLVVSLSYEGLHDNESAIWHYRRLDGTDEAELMTSNLHQPLDWENPPGRLVYVALPPGSYAFDDAGFARQVRPASTTWTTGKGGVVTPSAEQAGFDTAQYRPYDAKPFYLPFEINAGEVTYLGNLHFKWDEAAQTGRVMQRNRAERDLALLRDRLPGLEPEQVWTQR